MMKKLMVLLFVICGIFYTEAQVPGYVWQTGPWGKCQSNVCGHGGLQNRAVWCNHVDGWTALDDNCNIDDKPLTRRECFKVCKQHSYLFEWEIDEWSSCENKKGSISDRQLKDCGPDSVGTQKRDVKCREKVTNYVDKDADGIVQDYICELFGEKPLTVKPCLLPCKQNCIVSAFSDWTECSNPCGNGTQSRIRSVIVSPQHTGEQCPTLSESRLCDRTGECLPTNSARYYLKVGEWSACSVQADDNADETPGLPVGQQLRDFACVNSNGKLVSLKFAWHVSDWSPCNVRKLLTNDEATHLTIIGDLCGGGIREREAFCVRQNDTTYAPVDDSLCSEGPSPSIVEVCTVPCTMNCKVSPWSDWGICIPTTCPVGTNATSPGVRKRTRVILVEPSLDGVKCPPLSESMPCDSGMCFRWDIGKPGACMLFDKNKRCGTGNKTRTILCIDNDGITVSDSMCGPYKPQTSLACELPCPGDCVLGEWAPWSECSKTCIGKNNRIGSMYRNRSIVANPSENGAPCPNRKELQQMRQCGLEPCLFFEWVTRAWGSCEVAETSTNPDRLGDGICGQGIQRRDVQCVRLERNKTAQDERCGDLPKPSDTRPCQVPCTQDCHVSAFSDYNSCPDTCHDTPTIHRYRYILQKAKNGGRACPPNLHDRRLCVVPEHCHEYKWTIGTWDKDCKLPSRRDCGPGLQTRDVVCLKGQEPADINFCLKYSSEMPARSKPCNVMCDNECLLTNWSRWSDCSDGCKGIQTRNRKPRGKGNKKVNVRCKDSTLYPTIETRSCKCDTYTSASVGNWSQCLLGLDSAGQVMESQNMCKDDGTIRGLKYRAVICQNEEGQAVAVSRCDLTEEYETMNCSLPCPVNCQLSQWTPWTSCSKTVGSGIKTRTRSVIKPDMNGGRQCPPHKNNIVTEEVVCYTSPDQFFWKAGLWEDCSLQRFEENGNCGSGIQYRSVRCYSKATPVADEVPAYDTMCSSTNQPSTNRPCRIACSDELIVGEWSEWTECPLICTPGSRRQRERAVLRYPSSGSSLSDTTEFEACECNRYSWKLSYWGACELHSHAICGAGKQARSLDCINQMGVPVAWSVCQKYNLPQESVLVQDCLVLCPIDCKMSQWSEWTSCSQTCGLGGIMSRSRQMLQTPNDAGEACPPERFQQKPCPADPCYNLVVDEWGTCKAEDGYCGQGTRRREVRCIQEHNGAVVDDNKCVNKLYFKNNINITRDGFEQFQREQDCTVPCPGECQLTEWSDWSPCFIMCIKGVPSGSEGVQSRSRASISVRENCPADEIGTRPCQGDTCYAFTWHTGSWYEGERQVWCQRSDRVNVTGGCLKDSKPQEKRKCIPVCSVKESYCASNGKCQCKSGLRPFYSFTSGDILKCAREDELVTEGPMTRPSSGNVGENIRNRTAETEDDGEGFLGGIPVWMYAAAGGALLVIVITLVLIYFACCAPKKNKQPTLQQKHLELDHSIYWDDTAKRKYMDGVHV
ncbi:thrombospondin type-1 domain-containing protein 7B-like [Anneissia japonica]|uniref:thrombospondin type-1 domain-containing protein 7B-like n=1 Tax=Anneissia japonica TaxID=1529436 RepID=UPI001425937B|nr:thrombospondin type-1 domain-containing protein 7B-like [Anneissia japonica]